MSGAMVSISIPYCRSLAFMQSSFVEESCITQSNRRESSLSGELAGRRDSRRGRRPDGADAAPAEGNGRGEEELIADAS